MQNSISESHTRDCTCIVPDRLAGEHATLGDRIVAAGYGNKLSDDDVAELPAEMLAFSSPYFDLTGDVQK